MCLPLSLETAQKLDVNREQMKKRLPELFREIERDEQLKELFVKELENVWALELEGSAQTRI